MALEALNRANPSEILLAVRQRIADLLPLEITRVLIVAPARLDDIEHHAATKDVLLALGDEDLLLSEDQDGSARYAWYSRRSLEVVMRTRLSLDTSQEDRLKLLGELEDESLGLLHWERRMVDILAGWFPLDLENSDRPLSLPLRVGHIGKPVRDKDDPNWVSTRLSCSFRYLRSLTLPEVTEV